MLECRLRDQYDGERTGLARVTVDEAGRVSVMAWSDNLYEYATMPPPTGRANTIQPTRKHRRRHLEPLLVLRAGIRQVRVRTLRGLRCSSGR